MTLFATPDDIQALTGYTQRTAQVRWLTARGYVHDTDARGRPVVLRAEIERHLSPQAPRSREPRLRLVG